MPEGRRREDRTTKTTPLSQSATTERKLAAPQRPEKAKGKWTSSKETVQWALATDVFQVYTFTTPTGYKAVMKRKQGRRTAPYTCKVYSPDGTLASRVNENGHRITGMEMSLTLRHAKETVQEAVYEVMRQAEEATAPADRPTGW